MSNSTNGDSLSVWVYNYGDVKVVVDVYVDVDDGNSGSVMGTEIVAGNYTRINVSLAEGPLQKGDEVSIQVYSRRQNSVYYLFYV